MSQRILDIAPQERTAEQNEIFERLTAGRGRILTPYRVWIHSPRVAAPMEQLGTYLNKHSSLSYREVEMIILVVAVHWQADYVVHAHVREGKKAGLDQDILNNLCAGEIPRLENSHERAVYEFASSVIQGRRLSDKKFAALESELKRQGIADLLVLIGYYTSVALAMKVHDVPLPD